MKPLIKHVENPSGFDSFSNYMGETNFKNFYGLITQNRDSGTVTRSNFISALELLGGECDTVKVHRFGHWACGYWEIIAVKKDTKQFKIAEKIEKDLMNYPVVNEEHLSELEWNEAHDYWVSLSIQEKMEYCKKHNISIFSARYDYLPINDNGSLFDDLRQIFPAF